MRARPRLLWIPHAPWMHQYGRPEVLVPEVAKHFDVHVITWTAKCPKTAADAVSQLLQSGVIRSAFDGDVRVQVHHIQLPPPVLEACAKRIGFTYPPNWALYFTERVFQRAIARLHSQWRFDACVQASSHHFTGYPPVLADVPTIFDYVDLSVADVQAKYCESSSRIVVVSHYLKDHVSFTLKRSSRLIPNGLHLQRIGSAGGNAVRDKYNLHGKLVISLIGFTCSPTLYFLEAIASLLPEYPNVVFLGVGRGGEAIKERCRALGITHVMTGWVDPNEVAQYFAASDIGLYPGDDIPYFDAACPLKVLEYTGARVPVIANETSELKRLGFESVILSQATAADFGSALRSVLRSRTIRFPDLTDYDWSSLAEKFVEVIWDVLAQDERNCTATVIPSAT